MKVYNFEGKILNLLPLGENGLMTKVCPSNFQRRIEPSPAPVPKKIILRVKQFTSLSIKIIKTFPQNYGKMGSRFPNNLKLDELLKFGDGDGINLCRIKK